MGHQTGDPELATGPVHDWSGRRMSQSYPPTAAKTPTTTQITAQRPSDRSTIMIKDVFRFSRVWSARFPSGWTSCLREASK
jgi:hypothetical protein